MGVAAELKPLQTLTTAEADAMSNMPPHIDPGESRLSLDNPMLALRLK